jgi:hypothetical protein
MKRAGASDAFILSHDSTLMKLTVLLLDPPRARHVFQSRAQRLHCAAFSRRSLTFICILKTGCQIRRSWHVLQSFAVFRTGGLPARLAVRILLDR